MGARGAIALLSYLWTLLPMYALERLANLYYLGRNPNFYLISGWRLEVFILCALIGSVAAGALLKEFRLAVASQAASLTSFFVAVYLLCDPRVCYSAGPDGLEAARFGLFLASVAVAGCALGGSLRRAGPRTRGEVALATAATFIAITWYPLIFSLAGAKLLSPVDPYGALAVFFLAALSASAAAAGTFGRKGGAVLPVASLAFVLALSLELTPAYLGSVVGMTALMIAATALGGAMGALLRAPGREGALRSATLVAVALVLLMTLVVIPDAVSGVVPSGPGGARLSIGVPLYAGAYMSAPQNHSSGAEVTVNYAETNVTSIPPDGYLAAGLGVHSPNCCVDGIDYAYRSDLFLFHGGNESLVATGWEACDDNAACGGHSWKALLFSDVRPLGNGSASVNVTLRMTWEGGTLIWSYATGGGTFTNFTSFSVPPQEDHGFNTGVSGAVSLSAQRAAYFLQFGVMSGNQLTGAWKVTFHCPGVLVLGRWSCITHADTVQGGDSYWKVIWRWGENFPGVAISSPVTGTAVFERSSAAATESQVPLW